MGVHKYTTRSAVVAFQTQRAVNLYCGDFRLRALHVSQTRANIPTISKERCPLDMSGSAASPSPGSTLARCLGTRDSLAAATAPVLKDVAVLAPRGMGGLSRPPSWAVASSDSARSTALK